MKRNFYMSIALFLCSMLLVGAQAFGAPALYDDFSGTYIDSQRWSNREFVREVVSGKLVSKLGNASGDGMFRNTTRFQNPASINAIECDLTIVAANLDAGTDPRSFARVDGRFYNTQGAGGAKGDIWAAVYIGDRGSGLEAYWLVLESLDDTSANWEPKGSGTIATGLLSLGTAYTAKIEYDGTNGFTFTVAAASESFTGPDRKRAAFVAYKGLVTGIDANGGTGTGYASASFDDVYINNQATAYDDFSTAPLNRTKWRALEFVREISGGKLRLNVQADGSWTTATMNPNNQTTAFLEAKVLVESGSSVSSGARGIARIACRYYNDSRGPGSGQDYNGNDDDIWADNRIILDDSHKLAATYKVFRSDAAGSWTELFSQNFPTSIDFNTEYTLSIEFTGSTLIFKCNNDTYQYDITTPTYPPSQGQYRQLISRIYADPGESGYMKVNFDDVYTGYTAQATYDATGTWDVTDTYVWDSCYPNAQPETSTVTITQTGNDGTLVNEDGNTFTGTVSGTYNNLYGEFLDQGGTRKIYVTFTLSSSTSGNGSYYWEWTDGVNWCEGAGLFTFAKQVPPTVIEDDFNDGILDSVLWTSFGNENRYAIETNGRLEIRANGVEDDVGGVRLLGRLISVNEDFRVQVDFNSSECSLNSGIVLAVHNATTDLDKHNEYIAIANGHDADIVTGRSWMAVKAINDEFVEITTEPTAATSGTLYIEHKGNLFYVSFTGYGANNAFATFTTDGWTSCSEVFIALFGFTRNQVLSGEGSYLDNFHLDIGSISCGDVNLDEDLTPGDALLAFQHYLGIAEPPLDQCQLDQADVTLDDDITPADALCIFQKYLGIPSCLDGRPECPWD